MQSNDEQARYQGLTNTSRRKTTRAAFIAKQQLGPPLNVKLEVPSRGQFRKSIKSVTHRPILIFNLAY